MPNSYSESELKMLAVEPDSPSTAASPYSPYKSLYRKLPGKSIRLLTIQPGRDNDSINCYMEVFFHTRCPPYEALSYTWGSLECPKSITLNITTVSVGRNLWNALRSLRLKDKARTIWVDALCINQENITERNEQVLAMGGIYREATKVLIYLGESSEDTDAAFGLVAIVRRGLSSWVSLARFSIEEAKALMTLCYRPYWRRVWIIQEILAASEIEVICGNKSMEWAVFKEALKEFTRDNLSSTSRNKRDSIKAALTSPYLEEVRYACAVSPAAAITQLHHGTGGTYSLRDLLKLCSTCDSQCKDIRDKIYGLLSLCRDIGNYLVPDYTKTPSQLYLDVLATWLGHSVVATVDERPDLITFFGSLQRILRDPLWNQTREAFDPMHRLCRTVQLSRLQGTLRHVCIETLETTVQVGPTMTPDNRGIGIDYAETNWKAFIDVRALRESVTRLNPREFHQTNGLNALYTRSNTYFYISVNLEELNILLRTRSTGQCSIFLTASGHVGIASYWIGVGDLICRVPDIDDLILIIRALPNGEGFTLIGRALIFPSMLGSSMTSSPTETIEAFSCQIDAIILFLITR